MRVEITDGQFRTGMTAAAQPYATGTPWAAIPAMALKRGVESRVASFRIRAWVEGEGVRVLVFAVSRPEREAIAAGEQQLAAVFVPLGERIEIAAMQKYGARPITVSADRFQRRYVITSHGIDIPLRPWIPPRRPR